MASVCNSNAHVKNKNGIEVDVEIKGLGQIKEIQDIFIEHLRIARGDMNVY